MSSSKFEYEVVVIGGGSAGYAAASRTSAAGLRTAVVEGGAEVGGLCILRGCMPTKALLFAAEVGHLAKRAETWGIRVPKVEPEFKAIMARKNRVIEEFADYRKQGLTDGRFEFIRGRAVFRDPHTIELDNGETMTSGHFIIASGSTIGTAPIESLKRIGYLTSDEALQLDDLPRSIVVLGGGPVALEFAQFFHRMGTNVTIVQRSTRIMTGFDGDVADEVTTALRRDGITIHTGTRISQVSRNSKGKSVAFTHDGEERIVEADEIFFGLGRRPNTDRLNLETVGIRTEKGRIVTDSQMRTSLAHIYAAGDCTSRSEIVHIAVQQGEVAAGNVIDPERAETFDDRLLMSVVFTDPQAATVGMTENEARAKGFEVRTAKHRFDDHGKSIIMGVEDGFVKLMADAKDGRILGGACIGPFAGDLIHEITVAMAGDMTVEKLAGIPHYHPTLAEIWTYPAEELMGEIG